VSETVERRTRRSVPLREWLIWFGVLAVVTIAMLAVRQRLNEAHVALAYLLVVQGGSARGGRPLGIALACAAFITFDVLFLPPFGMLTIDNPLNWLVLMAFLGTGILSAQLLYRAQTEADAARERAAEIDRLSAERVRLAAEAERAVVLQQEHQTKDAIIASMSHDLRTPLTTIKGLAHEIAESGDERAEVIEEEADRLNIFVAQILDLSRIAAGTGVPDIQPNEAEDLLGAASQQVAGRLNGRELRIEVGGEEPLLFGKFDFAQTLRALVNLIENAAKYSPRGTPIDLSARRDGPWLVFAVADRGPGVPADERERIFEPFYRRRTTEPDVGGAGLGLSIARGIAEAQEGGVSYAEREGGGSVFSIRVPTFAVEPLDRGPTGESSAGAGDTTRFSNEA
jgi:two-component system sensor histidine kinase KdpD